MLSNPRSNLQNRQRLHRRQNSTPSAFDPVKVHDLPITQRHGAHRRGMSLDTRKRQTPPQETISVSTINQGYQTTSQHILRETQQQRLARPGQNFTTFDNDENYLRSPIVTPNRQSFDATCSDQYGEQVPSSPYHFDGPINSTIQIDPNTFNEGTSLNLFASETAMTPTEFLDFSAGFENGHGFQSSGTSRRSSGRRISNGIVDRVAQFEQLALKSPRPVTPPNQHVPDYFPPTPVDTPYQREIKHEQTNHRFFDNYDTSLEETIKPRNNSRAKGIFADLRHEAEMTMPSPPHSAQISSSNALDSAPMPRTAFMNLSTLESDFMKQEQVDSSQYSPESSNLSYHSSPELAQMGLYVDPFSNKPILEPHMSYPSSHGLTIPTSPDSYRRSESVSSMNIEETLTDTGITIDDIATYISGPDPKDGKWDCMYPSCKKRFGRKENIKSHVQTHLGDRQYQCPHCQKCFVRQHDLKRHAKIHSGVKPYPCQCGNSFARHDALTRHRQRGMCIGAFEGIVKKPVKRGRPRKHRPDHEERIKKSTRTRNKNKVISSASSTGGSESTSGHSPRSELDDILDDEPFGDYDYTQSSAITDSYQYSQPQSPAHLDTQCVSPQMTQTAHSPSAFSTHPADQLPPHPNSPAKSTHSYHSPPELCESSSSPAPSHHYYDLDSASSPQVTFKPMTLAGISEHGDDMFLNGFVAAANPDGMSQLERDPGVLLGKFDEFVSGGDYESPFFAGP